LFSSLKAPEHTGKRRLRVKPERRISAGEEAPILPNLLTLLVNLRYLSAIKAECADPESD
jgi:hypothetical protein